MTHETRALAAINDTDCLVRISTKSLTCKTGLKPAATCIPILQEYWDVVGPAVVARTTVYPTNSVCAANKSVR